MGTYGNLNPVLEVKVHGCSNLKNNRYFTKLHPYVGLNYVGLEYRTTTYRGGGLNSRYDQKFHFPLIEDVDQLDVEVYSRGTVTSDSFIGSGRVYLGTVLSTGYDETAWPIVDKRNKYAGEVKLTLILLRTQIQQPQIIPSAPPIIPSSPPLRTDSFETMDLPILGAINNGSISGIIENIGLFILNKALEYIGSKIFGRK